MIKQGDDGMKKNEIPVGCNADFAPDGWLTPRSVTLPGGRAVAIDKILSREPFEKLNGRAGIVFRCETADGPLTLCFDHRLNVWFLRPDG